MSRRILNYSRWPTRRCDKATKSDGGLYLSTVSETNTDDEFAMLLLSLSRRASQQKPDHLITTMLLTAWYGVVKDYTQRQIGNPEDRLPAIGGLARMVSQIAGMEYLAGLWRENLLYDLMWYTETRKWLNRPTIWRASTWSWTSIDSGVSYNHIAHDTTPIATALDCKVISSTSGPFGAVRQGELQLQGRIRRITTKQILSLFKSQDMLPTLPERQHLIDLDRQMLEQMYSGSGRKAFSLDKIVDQIPDQVFAMVTFKHSERNIDEKTERGVLYSGLLLSRMDDYYERIGSFKQEMTTWLDMEDE